MILISADSFLVLAARWPGPLPGDLAATRSLQGMPPDSIAASSLSYASYAAWVLPAATLIVLSLSRRWRDVVWILLSGATALLIGYAMKSLVARPRPPVEFARVAEAGYSFPSATTLLAVVLLGTACYLAWDFGRPIIFMAVTVVSALAALGVGLLRVYAGEHWMTDVVGAWILGLGWLLPLILAHRRWLDGRGSRGGEF